MCGVAVIVARNAKSYTPVINLTIKEIHLRCHGCDAKLKSEDLHLVKTSWLNNVKL